MSPPPDGRYRAECSVPGPAGWHLENNGQGTEGRGSAMSVRSNSVKDKISISVKCIFCVLTKVSFVFHVMFIQILFFYFLFQLNTVIDKLVVLLADWCWEYAGDVTMCNGTAKLQQATE